MTYILTEEGTRKVEAFINRLKELRTKYLNDEYDTCDTIDTEPLTPESIESDLANFTENEEYWNCWPITDHFNLPIVLNEGTDFVSA
jgi:carbon storage regulator